MRNLEKKLKALVLKHKLIENVETFCLKIREVKDKLDQGPDYKSVDLDILVAKKFINFIVEAFRITVINCYALI